MDDLSRLFSKEGEADNASEQNPPYSSRHGTVLVIAVVCSVFSSMRHNFLAAQLLHIPGGVQYRTLDRSVPVFSSPEPCVLSVKTPNRNHARLSLSLYFAAAAACVCRRPVDVDSSKDLPGVVWSNLRAHHYREDLTRPDIHGMAATTNVRGGRESRSCLLGTACQPGCCVAVFFFFRAIPL